jgi:hypothetical protein
MQLSSLIVAATLALPAPSAPPGHSRLPAPIQQASFSDWLDHLFSSGPRRRAGADPDAVGALPARYTGFDRRIWQNTRFDTVVDLLGDLPTRIGSAAQHRLARNLLIAIATPPEGGNGRGAMAARRIDHLMRLGNIDDVAALAHALPGMPPDETTARDEVEAELMVGQIESACLDLRAFAPEYREDWAEKGVALCKARDGDVGVETRAAEAGTLAQLTRAVAGARSADSAREAGAARDTQLSPSERLEAAFAAGRASAIDGDALAKLFRSASADAGAVPPGQPTSGAEAARLFHAIERAGDPAQKLALAERGLFSPDGVLDAVGVAMAVPIRALKPASGAQAARIAMLLFAAGDTAAAAQWAKLAGVELWPYRVLMKQAEPRDFAKWAKQSHLDARRFGRMTAILSAFGAARPAENSAPETPDLKALDQAARALRVGETALRALIVLGSDGPANADSETLHHVLAALDHATMHEEARALAFEAMTATFLGVGPRGLGGSRVAAGE